MSTIKLYPQDTVALATADLKKGETVVVDGQSIVLLDDIPNAQKIALKDFETGEAIRKYDNIIGYASRPIKKGEWIHEHNEVTGLGKSKEYTYQFNPVSIFRVPLTKPSWATTGANTVPVSGIIWPSFPPYSVPTGRCASCQR